MFTGFVELHICEYLIFIERIMGTRNKTLADLERNFQTRMEDFEKKLNSLQGSEIIASQSGTEQYFELLKMQFETFELEITSSLEDLKNELIQKSFSKNILVYGIEENVEEEVFSTVTNLFKSRLNINVNKDQLNNCFRMGKKLEKHKDDVPKHRPIVVEFVTQWMRDSVFSKKSKLKGSNIVMVEMLLKSKLNLFKKVREKFKNNCWTVKGNIKVKINNKVIPVDNVEQFNRIRNI